MISRILRMSIAFGRRQQTRHLQRNSCFNQKNWYEFNSKRQPEDDHNPNDQRLSFLKKVTFFTGLGVAAAYLIEKMATNYQSKIQQEKPKRVSIGGDWSLDGSGGTKFSSADLRGQFYLIYFGFTKCPQICPTTLRYATATHRIFQTLSQATKTPLKIVFVSVDPERDTPDSVGKYVKLFGSDIIGVTGSSETDPALKQCMSRFKIYANKIQNKQSPKNYDIDHTTLVFLMGPDNQFLTTINPTLSPKQSADKLLKVIENHQSNAK